jgi:hypothetical protein
MESKGGYKTKMGENKSKKERLHQENNYILPEEEKIILEGGISFSKQKLLPWHRPHLKVLKVMMMWVT